MFAQVPVRVWLLIFLGACAYRPARYVFSHIGHSPSRRDITQPPEDLGWRTQRQLIWSVILLTAIVGTAIFFFMPQAERVAQSPRFWPIAAGAFGAWALSTVPRAYATGTIEPLVRGNTSTYERTTQPKRYWASVAWNGVLGALFLWLGFKMNDDATGELLQDRCTAEDGARPTKQTFDACNRLVELNPEDSTAYLNRGLAYFNDWKFDRAAADFTKAHELDPKSPWPLADRGLVYVWKDDLPRAEDDFRIVRGIDPTNAVLLRGEGLLNMHQGNLEVAIDRFTTALRQDPADAWSLQMRSDAYQQMGDFEKARADREKIAELSKTPKQPPRAE